MMFVALAGLITSSAVLATNASANTVVLSSNQYVCPKCGKVHSHTAPPASVTQTSWTTPTGIQSVQGQSVQGQIQPAEIPSAQFQSVPGQSYSGTIPTSTMQPSGGTSNVLATLNAQRARNGIGSLGFDPQLQAVAERRAALMASQGLKNHPPGSFAPGRYEGVGWSSSYSPSGVSACFTNDPRMRVAGAAMATGRDGVYFCVVYR
ncbi:putative secreted protein [Rhodopirellula maiorica SM1]|uniref:Putative secreted protein n=2 Tax=Novipirellula TaxID=2795426 RepID=M5RZV2_9BACT|nr:putative secreted protein [Rhodopirellula maiorica SM1]